ncbi:MAG: hypothetical protein C4529_14490 [Deltaproteobacteria bacterium]|nr:MAG: hypothetical protein C4529_14490 [Deltaproteobacteria bacterium]
MQDRKNEEKKDVTREFEENPYDPDRMNPEDVMRHFFLDDVPILPVISKTGSLLGILRKDDLVSELSDIERVKKQKTDQFIQKLLKKMTLDDLLPYVTRHREFSVINIFGEAQGKWSRLQLLEASENIARKQPGTREIEKQRDDQVMDWIIYLILEHLPRPLYAMNNAGKTMFYNSHFEEIIIQNFGNDYDITAVEKSLGDPAKNDFYYNDSDEILFYNQELGLYYEKVPLQNKKQSIGFLIMCDRESNIPVAALTSRKNLKKQSLEQRLESLEKIIISETLKEHGNNIEKTASALKISKQALVTRAGKHGISLEKTTNRKKK